MKLFIASVLLCLYFFSISAFGNILNHTPMAGSSTYRSITRQNTWLNTSRALTPADLQQRIVLLDFWTFCCINCMHVIPDLHYLEKTFGNQLTIIGVHSAKFENERDTRSIQNAIVRYDILHPVVNDFDFSIWKDFGIRAWPSLVLISPDGRIVRTYSGEGNRDQIEADIRTLLAHYPSVSTTPLPLRLERNSLAQSELSFPGKLTRSSEGLWISDSGHHRIIEVSFNGTILHQIGSGIEGYQDGNLAHAQFRRPQGLLYDHPILYIADTGNHTLRAANLKTKQVTTLAGTAIQGYHRHVSGSPALTTPLASPWDIAFYPDTHHIIIAMAGTHQLWTYDIQKKTVSVLAGNGRESIDDGRYPENSLSQPSGLSVFKDIAYFVDAETSSLRRLRNKEIDTLIGTGLFDFGHTDGKADTAAMQHPLGVYAEGTDVYIADSYNHAIRLYKTKTFELSTLAGSGIQGYHNGFFPTAQFNEPSDIEKIDSLLYIADTNNHHIRILDLDTKQVQTLSIHPQSASISCTLSADLPNLYPLPSLTLAAEVPISVQLTFSKGWHLNAEAPSYLAVFKGERCIERFSNAQLREPSVSLKPFKSNNDNASLYRIQGVFYYCQDAIGSECLIRSIDLPLTLKPDASTHFTIPLSQ